MIMIIMICYTKQDHQDLSQRHIHRLTGLAAADISASASGIAFHNKVTYGVTDASD